MIDETYPMLCDTLAPPIVQGAAALATVASEGVPVETILAGLSGPFSSDSEMFAASFDTAVLSFLSAQPELGNALQQDLLLQCQLFRVAAGPLASGTGQPLKLLAFAAPGDLQMNMPIEFITHHLHVRLDIVYVLPGLPLPKYVPDHDVAICVISDSCPEALKRLMHMLARWPRPVLNDPGRLAAGRVEDLKRDGIARLFANAPGIAAPMTTCRTRAEIAESLAAARPLSSLILDTDWPLLVRPVGSHAGKHLARLEDRHALQVYVENVASECLILTSFVDYRDEDGFYRKYRLALIQGQAFLCHMAVSEHWMVHYLNAGMIESAAKRADEARAMAEFESGFGKRHRDALATVHERLEFDYVIIDCAESPDGRLLLFEVEMAAIIHQLDPEQLFPYKQPQMQRIFRAFGEMLEQAAGRMMA